MKRRLRGIPAAIPIVLIGLVVVLLPLSATVDLPLERQAKSLIGLDYKAEGCSPVYDRGTWGSWRREGRTPTPLEESRAVRVGNSAYLVGGVTTEVVDNFGHSTAAFRRYDFASGRFVSLPDLPRRLNHVGVAAHEGAVYAVGGLGDRLEFLSEASAAAWRYDIGTGTWSELPSMPTARGALGAAFVGDTLYAVGGRDGPTSYAAVEAFDAESEHWSRRASLPGGRDHLGLTSAGGSLYALGGRFDGGEELSAFLRYDPGADSWKSLRPLPIGTSGSNLEHVGPDLVVSGGEDSAQEFITGRTFAFDLNEGRWRELPSSPRPKHGYGSAAFRDRLYVFGGSLCAGSTPTDTIESLKVH